MPRDGDAGALMHEWLAFDLCAKNVEPEKTPRVGGLRRPDAKDKPAEFPKQTQRAVAAHRLSKAVVPARSSFSSCPALSAAISRQMFTLFEMSTGVPQASASTTAIPKFSW